MSKQITDSEKKSTTSKIFRWIMYVIMASIFILGTIITSVYITESRAKHQLDIIKQALNHLSSQENRISNLEKLPIEISNLNNSLNENIGSTNLLEENFKTLKEEVGNKKVELLSQQITNLNHRMDFVEETKNTESLILSIALLIKENILYGRNADTEINILSQMAKEQPEIAEVVEVGPGKMVDGKLVSMDVAKGDKVICSYTGKKVKLDGVEYRIVSQDDILAKIL